MSTVCPESGGVYTFAKKVLSVRAALAVGGSCGSRTSWQQFSTRLALLLSQLAY
jgi:hypothetical protein